MRFLAFLPLLLASLASAQTHQADIVIYGGTSAVQRINLGQLTEMLRAQGQVMSVPR